ncbi:MAG TPA: 16S rRNA (cytosine(967)-C(5))-methyltransferase RsmB [Steroidobacteraceae bacterium]
MARTPWAPGAPVLAAAALAVEAVARRGQSVEAALAATAPNRRGSPGESAVRAVTFGTLRWYLRLAPGIEELLERPSTVAGAIQALLVVAAHQVEYSRNAPEATVHAAVDAARLLGSTRATGLVNAVLRRLVRERPTLFERIDASVAGSTAHPVWLVEHIAAAWPQQANGVLAANNAHPPMTLRVDLSRTTPAAYVAELAARDIDAHTIQWSPYAVSLDRGVAVQDLPGFEQGTASVQDAGAQLAAGLLQVSPRMRVLDACAAPGGKTGHLLELMTPGADLTAVDIDPERAELITANLDRLKRTAHVCVGDAADPATFWNGQPFDRILVDAPCSSTGVIRRHPDIKLLRRSTDIPGFVGVQLAILRAALTMLADGGRLLYSTCSVLPAENDEVIAAILEAHPGVRPAALPAAAQVPGALEQRFGVQLLPGAAAGTDGFYYACLEKTTTGT